MSLRVIATPVVLLVLLRQDVLDSGGRAPAGGAAQLRWVHTVALFATHDCSRGDCSRGDCSRGYQDACSPPTPTPTHDCSRGDCSRGYQP